MTEMHECIRGHFGSSHESSSIIGCTSVRCCCVCIIWPLINALGPDEASTTCVLAPTIIGLALYGKYTLIKDVKACASKVGCPRPVDLEVAPGPPEPGSAVYNSTRQQRWCWSQDAPATTMQSGLRHRREAEVLPVAEQRAARSFAPDVFRVGDLNTVNPGSDGYHIHRYCGSTRKTKKWKLCVFCSRAVAHRLRWPARNRDIPEIGGDRRRSRLERLRSHRNELSILCFRRRISRCRVPVRSSSLVV